MVKVNLCGVTKVNTMVISTRIIFMALESIYGLMAESIMVSGLTTKWKAQEHSLGVMAEDTLDNIKMIKNMATAHSIGPMVESTLANGAKENSMEKELTLKKESRDKVFGKWEKEWNGLKMGVKQINDI